MAVDRYTDTPITKTVDTGKRNYETTIFPSVPQTGDDTFIITQDGDRLDTLAYRFYGDSSLWWVIGVSNGMTDSMFIAPGTKMRIPADVQFAISYMQLINSSR